MLIVATLNQNEGEEEQTERYMLVKIHDVDDHHHSVIDQLYNQPVRNFLIENEIGDTFSAPGVLINSSNEVDYIELRVRLLNPNQNLPRLRRFVSELAANKEFIIE